ncbi:hypothetical protein ACGFYA_15750 [Streptomyces sp. NPDC048305]|uniref:hypothetical protein n=1 Tax=Streptomyces sp. NPDC048305 TaxID=3365532 RepID=UPI003711BA74
MLHRLARDYAVLPVRDSGATFLTCAGGRTVAAVMVDGETVVVDGHSTRISEEDLVRRLLSKPERVGAPGQR